MSDPSGIPGMLVFAIGLACTFAAMVFVLDPWEDPRC